MSMQLDNGSRAGVIGGGPSGSLLAYFLLLFARRIGLDLAVDIFEPRDFTKAGPVGCNMCGGVVSESLVQALAAEGINLPPEVVKRGIDSYVLHMDVGTVRIDTPRHEMRIAAVYRGAGPKGMSDTGWRSFDGYLLELAKGLGAQVINSRVDSVTWDNGRPRINVRGGFSQDYDLLGVAVGVNTAALKLFEEMGIGYKSPKTTNTYISELRWGQDLVEKHLGSSMHVFLLNIPRLEFAALIPKGEYVTLCLLGHDIDGPLIRSFLEAPPVRECFPLDWTQPEEFCHCSPRISISGAAHPFADRVVFVGDSGITRLYKDGIGAAYRTAKPAARTAIFRGVAADDFRRYFWPACRAIASDNSFGKVVFAVTRQIQQRRYARRGVLRMVSREQRARNRNPRMSMVLWDTFTGSAPYQDIFMRAIRPFFLGRLMLDVASAVVAPGKGTG
ncbi:MAG: hypothetical protein HY676_02620 [Chloroflexi bacterium]|nr:hypothetical protein [Chloroflexota bacterium]